MDIRNKLNRFSILKREYENKIHKERSKLRLNDIAATKIRTTMVGAWAAFEKSYGDTWGQGKPYSKLTEEQRKNYKIKEKLRREIFDLGNNNIRNMNSEIEQYEISWNKFNITLKQRNEES